MDFFSSLPRKHKIVMCYGFIVLMVLLIVAFAVALIFASGWKSVLYLVAIVLLSGIIVWVLKGGKMEGNINKNGLGVKLDDGIHREDAKLPGTYVLGSGRKKMR